MKIKVVILDDDAVFLERLIGTLNAHYADKLEVFSFTGKEAATDKVREIRADIFLVGEAFEDDEALRNERGFTWLIGTPGVDAYLGYAAIGKFQKVDQIYKNILNLYAEYAAEKEIHAKVATGDAATIVFSSPSGGVGTSSLAAACAAYYAAAGKRALYLTFDELGTADVFFVGDGMYSMTDVIYALKSKKANLAIKIESCIKHGPYGISFFSGTKTSMDMLELKPEEKAELLTAVRTAGLFDYVILDYPFSMTRDALKLIAGAHIWVSVTDGSAPSVEKTERMIDALGTGYKDLGDRLLDRMSLLYNRYDETRSGRVRNFEAIDTMRNFPNATEQSVIETMMDAGVFEKIGNHYGL